MIQALQQRLNFSSQQRLLLFLAVLCLALLALPSSGIVRYGGEEDEGSGIGGTGRYRTPGSDSGLGGTGFRPYVGYSRLPEANDSEATGANDALGTRELVIYHDPANREYAVSNSLELNLPLEKPITEPPLAAPARVAELDDFVTDSSAILISEQIQRDLEADALYYSQLESSLIEERMPETSVQIANSADALDSSAKEETAALKGKAQVSWQALASYLKESDQLADQGDTAYAALAADNEEPNQRTQRPERLQRPELPPMQRVRPVQRAGVLPPRVKPLSL